MKFESSGNQETKKVGEENRPEKRRDLVSTWCERLSVARCCRDPQIKGYHKSR